MFEMTRRYLAAAGIVAVAVGYCVGAAVASPGPSRPPVAAAVSYDDDLAPYERLGNGATAGSYRVDTPLDERPDFVPSQTSEGESGYLRIEDFDPRVTQFDPSGAVSQLSEEDADRLRRSPRTKLEDAGNGDVWAPIYDKDGETVIGRTRLS